MSVWATWFLIAVFTQKSSRDGVGRGKRWGFFNPIPEGQKELIWKPAQKVPAITDAQLLIIIVQ